MSERKTLKEALKSPEAVAFVQGKMDESDSLAKEKRSSMKDIKSVISSNDAKVDGYKKRMTTDVPPDVHQRLKFALADMKINSNKLMNALLVNFLDENNY